MRLSSRRSRLDVCRAVELAPGDDHTLKGPANRLPHDPTQEDAIDDPHRQDDPALPDRLVFETAGEHGQKEIDDQENQEIRQSRGAIPEEQRYEQAEINQRRERDEKNLEEPNAWQTKETQRAKPRIEHHVAMFPKALHRPVGP